MTEINFDGQAITEFAEASANARSLWKGLEHMGARGLLRQVAREISELAERCEKAGYVPPEHREKYEYHDRLAKSVQDREVAAWHREKAREIAKQIGEVK
jgi:uncharacterized coiled-coil DUF342 family protein